MCIRDSVYAMLESGLARGMAARGHAPAPADPLALWPRAAVGLVRAAAETWLRTPAAGRIPVEAMARAIADWLLTGLIGAAPGAALEPAAADAVRARPHSRTGASS